MKPATCAGSSSVSVSGSFKGDIHTRVDTPNRNAPPGRRSQPRGSPRSIFSGDCPERGLLPSLAEPWGELMHPLRLAALVLTVSVAAGGCTTNLTASSPPAAQPSTPSVTSSPAATSSASASDGRLRGLVGDENFAISMVVPSGAVEIAESAGTRGFKVDGGGMLVTDLSRLAGTPVGEIPDDVAGFLQESVPNLVVEEVGAAQVDGRAAQSFTLQQAKPSDLWCANRGACFKLLPMTPMDVIAARTPTGMLWLTAEYAPEHRERVRSQFRELVNSIVMD